MHSIIHNIDRSLVHVRGTSGAASVGGSLRPKLCLSWWCVCVDIRVTSGRGGRGLREAIPQSLHKFVGVASCGGEAQSHGDDLFVLVASSCGLGWV